MTADEDALLAAVSGKAGGTLVDQVDKALKVAWRMSSGMNLTLPQSGSTPGPYRAGGSSWDLAFDQATARWGTAPKARTVAEKVVLLEALVRGIDKARAGAGGEAAPSVPSKPAPAPASSRFVPPGVKVTWSATLDGASSRTAVGYNDDDWEYEPKDAKGTRCPVPVDDPTGAGRGKVLSAYIPSGLGAKGRSEAHPKAPNAKAGVTVAWGYDLYVRSISSGTGQWGGDVLTQYAQGGYTPALELKLGGGKLFLDGNSGSWHHELGAVPTGRWVSVAVRAVMSTTAGAARLDVWLDGRQVLTDARPKGAGTLYGGGHNPYPKHGLYAAPGRGGEVLFDNVWWGS